MNEYYGITTPTDDFLAHYGILGMRWGARRYQNSDGSYTKAGQRKNAKQLRKAYKKLQMGKGADRLEQSEAYKKLKNDTHKEHSDKEKAYNYLHKLESDFYKNKKLVDKHRRILSKKYANKYGWSEQEYYDHMKNGDFDQGESFDHYLKTNKKAMSEYKKRMENFSKSSEKYDDKVQKSIDASLGAYQNMKRSKKHKHGKYSMYNVSINGKRYAPTIGSSLKYHSDL